MSFINYAGREINLKLVYYGPGLSGKTTNVKYVHSRTDPGRRGALLRLETDSDRTLFFDFTPIDVGRIGDFKVRLHLYSVPGQIHYAATRRLVMRGADGVVFVADSQEDRLDANLESLDNLRLDFAAYVLDTSIVPCIVQYNKRDSPSALPIPTLRAALNQDGWPEFAAVAATGEGVFDTLRALSRLVVERMREHKVAAR